MFKLYKTWLLKIIRNPMNLCWAIIFPCVLITLFSSTMGNLDKDMQISEKVNIQMVALEDNMISDQIKEIMAQEEIKRNYEMNTVSTEEEAIEQLKQEKTDAYFTISKEGESYKVKVICRNDKFKVSMTKGLFENYVHTVNMNYTIMKMNQGQVIPVEAKDYIEQRENFSLEQIPSMIARYTYPAIIFSILQVGILISEFIYMISPILSNTGARIDVAPTKKGKIVLSSILALFTMGMVSIVLVTLYANCILKIEVGFLKYPLQFLILYASGVFTCIALGALITFLCGKKKTMVESVCSGVMMILYFIAGGMIATLPIWIKDNLPILHYINPASTLSDGIMQLTYHQNMPLFWLNVACTFGIRSHIFGISNCENEGG